MLSHKRIASTLTRETLNCKKKRALFPKVVKPGARASANIVKDLGVSLLGDGDGPRCHGQAFGEEWLSKGGFETACKILSYKSLWREYHLRN